MKLFRNKEKKKLTKRVDCININAMDISTGQIGAYIAYLYLSQSFRHIGYEFVNMDGMCRYVIYTLPGQKQVIQYFKDRCPAMVEKECMEAPSTTPFKMVEWDSNFTEVQL